MSVFLIFRNNMGTLFTPYYFYSWEDCISYMDFNWPNQKYHIKEVQPSPLTHKPS